MKKPTQFRLSETVRELLDLLARETGLSNTAVVETAIREKAKATLAPKLIKKYFTE